MGDMLRIGEAARLLGVCADTLRRWEREGKMVPAWRTPGGERRYSVEQIATALNSSCESVALSVSELAAAKDKMDEAYKEWQRGPMSKEEKGWLRWRLSADRFEALQAKAERHD